MRNEPKSSPSRKVTVNANPNCARNVYSHSEDTPPSVQETFRVTVKAYPYLRSNRLQSHRRDPLICAGNVYGHSEGISLSVQETSTVIVKATPYLSRKRLQS